MNDLQLSYYLPYFSHIDKRELIVAIDDGCLVQQAGVEVWDIIDKLCGVPVNVIPKGRVSDQSHHLYVH